MIDSLKVTRSHGYTQDQANHKLFHKKSLKGKIFILTVNGDDILIIDNDVAKTKRMKCFLGYEEGEIPINKEYNTHYIKIV